MLGAHNQVHSQEAESSEEGRAQHFLLKSLLFILSQQKEKPSGQCQMHTKGQKHKEENSSF